MDTDELSTEAYEGIIIESEKFNHDLTLRFGVMASSCKNEKEYLSKAKKIIGYIQKLDKSDLTEMFFALLPDEKSLRQTLQKILSNISAIEKIPEDKRHYEFW